jgi:hypothetical protein
MAHRRSRLKNADDPLGLFGDGPPRWSIMEGKIGERPSSSAHEATRERDMMASILRRHAKLMARLEGGVTANSMAASALADKFDHCDPPRYPCLSGTCPVCTRAVQRWFVRDTLRVLSQYVADPAYRPQVLSVAP